MWLYVPGTHSASVPVSEPSISHLKWLFLNLSRHVTSKGKLQQPKSWSLAWKKGRFPALRSTLICSHSKANRGVESYIRSLRGSLASHTPLPESNSDTMTSAPSGPPSSEWWERCSQKWFGSKTSLHFWDTSDPLEKSYQNWATSLRSRCSSLRAAWAPAINENVSLRWHTATESWPTPRQEDSESCGNHPDATDSLTGATRNWPTPDAQMFGNQKNANTKQWDGHNTLVSYSEHWQTPATDSFRSRGGDRVEEMGLDQEARFWRTPRTITGGAETAERKQELGRTESGGGDLQAQVTTWGTPTSRDWKDGSSADADCPTNGLLGRQVIRNWPTGGPDCLSSRRDPEILVGLPSSETSRNSLQLSQQRRLNPMFVNWMHGWPIWWTCTEQIPYAPQAMALHLYALRQLLESLLEGRG